MSNQTHQVELAPAEPVVRPVSLANPPAHLQALRDVVVGTQVVYPVHGVAMVVGNETRTVGAETHHYLVLLIRGELRSDDLTIHVLADRLEDLGVRHTMSAEDAGDVLKVLAVRNPHLSQNWSRRFKNHQVKLRTGDVFDRAEVVRNLTLRDRQRPLAAAEKAMYRQARHGLITELAVTWGISPDAAAERVDSALRE